MNKKKNNDDDDDTKFVNSRLTVFSCGELTVGMNLIGICIARNGQNRGYWRVLKAWLLSRRVRSLFVRGSREI